MNPAGGYALDHARHLAAARCHPEHIADFQRLAKTLSYGGKFQILFLEFNDWTYREELLERIGEVLAAARLRPARITLSPEAHPDFAAVEAELVRQAKDHEAVHLTGGETWFDPARWEAFNIRREALSQSAPARLLVWLTAESLARLALLAPDLWAWRGGVFSFRVAPAGIPLEPPAPRLGPIDTRRLAERSKRIAVLREFLRADPPPPDDLAGPLLDELAGLLASIGELDAALRIREQEQLPVFERLGDVREKAVTQGKIADILEARGELDAALRIREQEQLPVFERLGDVRVKAVTQGRIADILQARGELDAALRIREQEELPVFERLGDVREKAVTQGRIADILQARGELDAALRIREQEELPVYERLGDVRLKAVTQGRIADILQARGELDAALRIREQEELPVYERLGDVRSKAVTLFKIARIELDREQYDAAMGRLREAYEIAERMKIPDGLAAVGAVYGPLLCREGERDRGLAVLETAREAAAFLGQDSAAAQLQDLIARHRSGAEAAEPPRPNPPGFWSRLWRRLAGKP